MHSNSTNAQHEFSSLIIYIYPFDKTVRFFSRAESAQKHTVHTLQGKTRIGQNKTKTTFLNYTVSCNVIVQEKYKYIFFSFLLPYFVQIRSTGASQSRGTFSLQPINKQQQKKHPAVNKYKTESVSIHHANLKHHLGRTGETDQCFV